MTGEEKHGRVSFGRFGMITSDRILGEKSYMSSPQRSRRTTRRMEIVQFARIAFRLESLQQGLRQFEHLFAAIVSLASSASSF